MHARWDDLQRLFQEAFELSGGERKVFLADKCPDAGMRADLEGMLRHADAARDPIENALEAFAEDQAQADREDEDEQAREFRERVERAFVENYRITGELGRGGMAVVFAGRDLKHDRPVAVKVMRPEAVGGVSRQRFGIEIRLAAQLSHPHVLPLYDSGEVDGLLYYVSAEVLGRSLAEKLRDEAPLAIGEALAILHGVAAALDYAHHRLILHRDVKPANILLQDGIPLLADFGIGKALGAPERADLTQLGLAVGTPPYMSPEQLWGEQDLGPGSDIYGLGCVAYEMLTGKVPVDGSTPVEVATRRLKEGFTPPSELNTVLGSSVDALFKTAFADDPAGRFESAAAFVSALEAALEGRHSADLEGQRQASSLEPPSVAVMAFRNLSPGDEDDYLSDGISEQLLRQLSGVRGLRVVARSSSFAFKGKDVDARSVCKRLSVRHLVEGNVQRSGDRLRVSAALVDGESGFELWSDRLDRALADVFDLQDDIVHSIVVALRGHLVGHQDSQAAVGQVGSLNDDEAYRHPVPDIHAYEYYLRARHEIFSFTAEGLGEADVYLDRGLEILGDNESLLSAKGYAFWQRVNAGIDPDPANLEKALECAERIEALQPASHHASRIRGLVAIHMGEVEAAIALLWRVMEADPEDTDAAFWLTLLHGFRGQPNAAEPLARMILAVDPLNPLHQFLPGFLALMRGDLSQAPPAFRKALEMEPDNPVLRLGCGQAEAMAGDSKAATATLELLETYAPGTLFSGLGRLLRSGLSGESDVLSEDEERAASSDLQWAWTAAQGYALQGQSEEAITWIGRACDLGLLNYPLVALYDPLLQSVRGLPEFEGRMVRLEPAWADAVQAIGVTPS